MSNRHGEKHICLEANRVGMGQDCVLSRPLGYLLEFVIGSKDAERTDSHQCTIRLASEIRLPTKATTNGAAAVERAGVKPENISVTSLVSVVSPLFHQHPSQRQSHLGVIGWLSSECVPSAPVCKFTNAVWICSSDIVRRLKLDQTAQGIPGKLTK